MSDNKKDKNIKAKESQSAMHVHKGIEQPPSINPKAAKSFLKKKQGLLTLDQYVDGILKGDRIVLSKAITLIESSLPQHYDLAQKIIEKCMPYSGNSIRIGVTGIPGAGKSTFIEALGKYLTAKDHKIAVLAVDPSSEISKGSILGDKTRMEGLSTDKNAFVRPSPTAGSLGGVARKTREIIILCEAAGFNRVFVETVGVGQSETTVHSMVDFFLLLMLTETGDELQGIKRGVIEMSDGIIINKADGDNIQKAEKAKNQYQKALKLFPKADSSWTPKVLTCSALEKTGIDKIWDMILEHNKLMKETGHFRLKRNQQKIDRMYETINQTLSNHFYTNPKVEGKINEIERSLLNNRLSAFQAAQTLLNYYFEDIGKNKANQKGLKDEN